MGATKTYYIKHLSGVSSWNTEPSSWLDDGRRWEAHHHRADVSLQHLPAESTVKK